MSKPCLLIMAGGTGGHVFPGLAVAKHMHDLGWNIQWLGTADKMEAQLVPKHGFDIHFVNIAGMRGKALQNKLLTPFKLIRAVFQAAKIIRRTKTNIVLGMGGYASGPGGIAAKILRKPLIIHEQNAIFGLTNRYLAKVANVTMTGFDLSQEQSRGKISQQKIPKHSIFVGNPVRQGFFKIEPKSSQITKSINILVVGGSLGALALNQIVPSVIKQLSEKYQIFARHQAGKGKAALVKDSYAKLNAALEKTMTPRAVVYEFIDSMEECVGWADIVICRAGALTVAELAAAGRLAIFVPLPIAVDDHQKVNAEYLSHKDAAIVIEQAQLQDSLYAVLEDLCNDKVKIQEMSLKAKNAAVQDATMKVANILHQQLGLFAGQSVCELSTRSAQNKEQL